MAKSLKLLLPALCLLFHTAHAQSVFDVIENSPDHNTLQAAIEAAGLDGKLDDAEGTFTVFAPTDQAFNNLPEGTVESLLQDPSGTLTQILLYHVVGAEASSTSLSNGQEITTLNGKKITVTIEGENVFINDAQVTIADIETDNGVVHVIDAVLIPPVVTVFDIIEGSEDHNTLEAAIEAAGLDGTLDDAEGTFTVFAPTDQAFNNLPEGAVESLLQDPSGALTQILLYHVVGAEALSSSLSDGQEITTLNGKKITVTIEGENVFINDAQVTIADIETDNGVVHVIDAVLIPPVVTVFDIIEGSEDHNTLEAAIEAAGLDGTLDDAEGTFTVFAPTDQAFNNLPEGTVETLLQDPSGELTQILLYHVVNAEALSSSLSDGQEITTLNGNKVTVSIEGENVFINDARVIVADIETDNGIVHVIDAVLIPGVTTSTKDRLKTITSIYPNPASDKVTVDLNEAVDRVEIMNASGHVVKTAFEKNVNVSDLAEGLYHLKIFSGTNVFVSRLMIQ